MEHDLLRITLRGIARHPGLLWQPRRTPGSAASWYGRVRDAAMDRVQADFFRSHPDGIASTGDFRIRLHRTRHILSASVVSSGRYEPRTSELFRSLLKDGCTVVDVGANIGWFTLLSARHAGTVWAFEPDVTNFGLLESSVAVNGFTNVKAFRQAVGNVDGSVPLWLSEYSAGWHSTSRQVGASKVDVPCRRLDSLFPEERIDVLKVDVEGGEPDVLLGASQLIRSGRIGAIVMEWNPGSWAGHRDLLEPFDAFEVDGVRRFAYVDRPPEGNVLLRPRS